MKTAELIARLASDDTRTPRYGAPKDLLGPLAVGCAVSFLAMWAWLGIRPDLGDAIHTFGYWIKFAYTLSLAAIGFRLIERLGRPGADGPRAQWLLVVPVAIVVALAIGRLAGAPPTARAHLLFGASSNVCPWRIIALSLPIFAGAGFGLRRLAPTRLVAAGVAAGLLAGAAGAWVYAFHCDESTTPFIAVWYTLGIAVVGAIGGALGNWLLRW
ncbi:MAG TPA: DUF1109 domain-containing protein [Rhizomicrobium sp.]